MFVFDFDGTIVDLWPRYCAVFKSIMQLNDLSLNDYKSIKQKYKKDSLVADYFGKELPEDYFSLKAALLEDRDFLKLDIPLIGIDILNSVLIGNSMILTKRRNADNFLWQIKNLGICEKYQVLNEEKKSDWVKTNTDEGNSITVIGDSVADLEIATLSNVDAWMVGYGLSTRQDFDLQHIPYLYLETPNDLEILIRRRIILCNSET